QQPPSSPLPTISESPSSSTAPSGPALPLNFPVKPITRVHSTPSVRPSPDLFGGEINRDAAQGMQHQGRYVLEDQLVQAQLGASFSPTKAARSQSLVSALPPASTGSVNLSTLGTTPSHCPTATEGSSSGSSHSPALSRMSSRRIFRKPLLNFNREDPAHAPLPLANMPLPTPPPPSHSRDSRFDLQLGHSIGLPESNSPHSPGSNHRFTIASGGRSFSLGGPDSSGKLPTMHHLALPSPVASPAPPPVAAQRFPIQRGYSGTVPSTIREELLSTPPGSPADHLALTSNHTPLPSSQLASPIMETEQPQCSEAMSKLEQAVNQLPKDSQLSAKSSRVSGSTDAEDLTPPPSPPQSITPVAVVPEPVYTITRENGEAVVSNNNLNVPLSRNSGSETALTTSYSAQQATGCQLTLQHGAPGYFMDASFISTHDDSTVSSTSTYSCSPTSSLSSSPQQTITSVSHPASASQPSSILKKASSQLFADSLASTASVNSSPSSTSLEASTQHAKQLRFAETVLIYETFDPTLYDRRGEAMMRLTPEIAYEIKTELNNFKMYELIVHEESKQYTHFIP
ncbi:hypothetical protein IWQ62_006132, partial [Dispira parvispora]